MKTASILLFTLISTTAMSSTYLDTADIISVKPVLEDKVISEPYENCYIRDFAPRHSASSEILGGIIGGAIGNRFGGGSGKDAMTVAGVLLGASMASDNNYQKHSTSREVCETRYRRTTATVISHYKVGYEYNNNIYYYNSTYKPTSPTLKIKLNIQPY